VKTADVRRHVWIDGVVQGVFFRVSTIKTAQRIGVTGWVRNLPDGRVEAVFEGDPEAVATAIRWCGVGPEHAVVESVDSISEEPEGLASFAMKH